MHGLTCFFFVLKAITKFTLSGADVSLARYLYVAWCQRVKSKLVSKKKKQVVGWSRFSDLLADNNNVRKSKKVRYSVNIRQCAADSK